MGIQTVRRRLRKGFALRLAFADAPKSGEIPRRSNSGEARFRTTAQRVCASIRCLFTNPPVVPNKTKALCPPMVTETETKSVISELGIEIVPCRTGIPSTGFGSGKRSVISSIKAECTASKSRVQGLGAFTRGLLRSGVRIRPSSQ